MNFDGLYYEILQEDMTEQEANDVIRSFEQDFCEYAEKYGFTPVRRKPPNSHSRMHFGTRINLASSSLLKNLVKGSYMEGYLEHRENGDIYLEASIPKGWSGDPRRDDFEALIDEYSDAEEVYIDMR